MPLYDCMLLLKHNVKKEAMMDLVTKVGKHVYKRNGVLTEIKSYGTVQLGYGIKKLDGKHFQGQMLQMTMMTPPSFNSELHYLNKEDRLLRWLLVKHRDVKIGIDFFGDVDAENELRSFKKNIMEEESDDTTSSEEDDYEDGTEESFAPNTEFPREGLLRHGFHSR